jgi:hypothetical protein
MPLDQRVAELPLAVPELEAVLLQPRWPGAKRSQLLSFGHQYGDAILQLLDFGLVLVRCDGAEVGKAHLHRVAPIACRSHVESGTKFALRAGELSTEALWRRSACGYVYEATVTESPRRIVPPATTPA